MTPLGQKLEQWAVLVLCIILLIVAVQQIWSPFRTARPEPAVPPTFCMGDPIRVAYPFNGGYIEDHACLPQCADSRQRYVLYTNGKATQCGVPPNCNDVGEDTGVTCVPPSSALSGYSSL